MPDNTESKWETSSGASALAASQAARVAAERSADALRISELRYRRLFEAARDGILLLDATEGRITDSNPFMTELLGYSRDELLGKELWEIGLLQDEMAGREAFLRLRQEGYSRYEDLPLENRRGERREVEFVSNVYRENGKTVIQCNIRDITDRKKAEAELAAAAERHGRQAAILEERTRIAREIHDMLAQGFTGIAAQLDAAEAALANAPEPDSPAGVAVFQTQLAKVLVRIGKARDLARESLAEARRSVAALRAAPAEAAPISRMIADFLAERVLETSTTGRFVLNGVPHDLSPATEHCVLRVGQEAITNAVDHAQAGRIDVTLTFETEQVRLHVQDDGRGFDTKIAGSGRFGLIGMRERSAEARGKLTIVSRLGGGTQIDLVVPIAARVDKQE